MGWLATPAGQTGKQQTEWDKAGTEPDMLLSKQVSKYLSSVAGLSMKISCVVRFLIIKWIEKIQPACEVLSKNIMNEHSYVINTGAL